MTGEWSCPGLMGGLPLSGSYLYQLSVLVGDGRAVVEGRVPAPRVVPAFDEVEDREPGLRVGPPELVEKGPPEGQEDAALFPLGRS
jgi:hypothetical protein